MLAIRFRYEARTPSFYHRECSERMKLRGGVAYLPVGLLKFGPQSRKRHDKFFTLRDGTAVHIGGAAVVLLQRSERSNWTASMSHRFIEIYFL